MACPEGVATAACIGKPLGHRALGTLEFSVGNRTDGGLDRGAGLTDCGDADGVTPLGSGVTDCGTGSGGRDDIFGGLETTGASAPGWSWMARSS